MRQHVRRQHLAHHLRGHKVRRRVIIAVTVKWGQLSERASEPVTLSNQNTQERLLHGGRFRLLVAPASQETIQQQLGWMWIKQLLHTSSMEVRDSMTSSRRSGWNPPLSAASSVRTCHDMAHGRCVLKQTCTVSQPAAVVRQ